MSSILPFVIVGLTSGAIYGLTGTGLVLTYKTSGILNFAYGALATVAAYAFYWMWVQEHLPWPVAGVIAVVVLGTAMGLGMELLGRRLSEVSAAMKIVGTIGIVLVVEGLALAIYGDSGRQVPQFLPTSSFKIGGVFVGYDQVIIIGISLLIAGGLFAYLRSSRTGTAMRAVVDDPELLAATGMNPAGVRRASWIIGTMLACLSGVLLVPSIGLDPTQLTLLVLEAFGAAAIGRFTSLPFSYAGGLVVGVIASILTKYVGTQQILSALPSSIPFLVLFVVLVVIPRRKLAGGSYAKLRPRRAWRAPARFQVGGGVALLALLLLVPMLVGTNLPVYASALTDVIVFLSLGLLVRGSGQVSLAQAAFAAIGAAAFAHFTTSFGLPWLLALLLAGAVAVPISALIAIPAIRLPGVYLALATLGFGILVDQMFYSSNVMFTPFGQGIQAPRPGILSLAGDRHYYYLLLVFAVVAALFVVVVNRSRLGRLLRAMGDSAVALGSLGASANVARILVFALSAFLAAIAGGLAAGSLGFVSGAQFNSNLSLTYITLLALVAAGAPWYAFGAAFGLDVIPSFFNGGNVINYLNVLFGASAVFVAVTVEHSGGAPARLIRLVDRLGGRRSDPALVSGPTEAVVDAEAAPADALRAPGAGGEPAALGARTSTALVTDHDTDRAGSRLSSAYGQARGSGLRISEVTVRFGGAVAVNSASLEAPTGRITGLIGPNGAGKTTIFNVCSGLVRPLSGRVVLDDRDITGLSPSARARRGLGRTFQRMELFESMTVAENVAIGAEASLAGAHPLRQLASRPSERARVRRIASEMMEICDVQDLASTQAGLLSTGQRRLVELARCLAGPFDVLLLDEPSSGLDEDETHEFAAVLKQVSATRGTGILLVEHDMSLVMDVCAHIYVLDFGVLISEGTPVEISESQLVRRAYLGSEEVATQEGPSAAVTN